MKIGEKLRNLRIEHGLLQREVGQALQTTQTAVGKWEREENLPNVYILIKLAKFYNISFDELLEDVDEE